MPKKPKEVVGEFAGVSLFSKGRYTVVAVKELQSYVVINTETDITELQTPVLYEALRFARAHDEAVNNELTEKEAVGWAKSSERKDLN